MALWGRVIICGKADKAIINEGNMRDKVTYMEESEFVALANTDRMSVFLICIKNGSLSIVGVGFVKILPQFYEKGPFYV